MGRIFSRKYEELELLGQGGQAVVYKVRHIDHKTILALKVLPSYLLENEEMVARFNREALLMARLRHRNIVRVIGSGHDDDLNCHFILMENIQGRTLKQYLRDKGPLPLAEVLEIVRQIAAALDYAHRRTPVVIHRDIKPSNIMIEDLTGRAILLDFGIAKELDDGERTRTRTGLMIGTWKYSSPEQLRHEPLTGSADIYSLGLVMYELYTGTHFFSGLDERAVIGKLLYEPEEHEPHFSRPAPLAFVSLVTKAIAKSRDKRYPSMTEFLDDLEACWSVLDETRTQVLVPADYPRIQPEPGRDRIEEIGEQIRKLEQERQLYLVKLVQQQVRDARLQAEKTGALQLVSALFTEAIALEEKAAEHLRAERYVAAQEAYAAALNCFLQTNEDAAVLVLRRQVEELQHVVESVRADAEHYGVDQQAHGFYAHAVAVQERAEEFKKQEQYEQARQTYSEAKSLFEDARDLAYHHAIKGEAEAARAYAYTTRENARGDGAWELASSFIQEATATEQQAEAALDQDEFTQARALYQLAGQKYEQAQQQAHRARRRQKIAAIAESVQGWQKQALDLGVSESEPDYRQATAAQADAVTSLTAGDYTQAEGAYTLAQQFFEALVHAAERKQQQHALQAQTEAQQAKIEAEQAEAQQWAAESYHDAVTTYEHAELSFAQGAYGQATQEFANARHAFISTRAEAQQNVLKESAHAAQRQMVTARATAEQAGAKTWARNTWHLAVATEQDAVSAWHRGDFEQARLSFLGGQQQYGEATQQAEAEHDRQQQAAAIAAEEVRSAQQGAVDADVPDTNDMYQQAASAQRQAETHVAAQEYESAVQVYGHAQALYEEAILDVERERQRQNVLSVRQKMVAARESASAVAANHYDGTAWNEIDHMVVEAQQYEAREQFSAAAAEYEKAAQRFSKLRDEAVLQALYQHALTAQQQTQMAKAHGTALREWASSSWQDADALEAQAEQTFRDQHYEHAAHAYGLATRAYQRAIERAQAERRQQEEERQAAAALFRRTESTRHAAERARQQAGGAAAETYAPQLYSQALALYNDAETWWHRQSYEQAVGAYAQAQQIFIQAVEVAQDEVRRKAAAQAREQMEAECATAQQLGAKHWFEPAWTQLERDTESARHAELKKSFAEAVQLYEHIAERFVQLQQAAQEENAREKAEAVRGQLQKVQIAPGELWQWAAEALSHARKREGEAEQAYRDKNYDRAATLYQEAVQLFIRAREHAVREQQAAQQVLLRQTETARQSCITAQQTALQVNIPGGESEVRDHPLFMQAQDIYQRTEMHIAAHAYEQAIAMYGQAHARYEEAARAVRLEHEQAEAAKARQYTLSVRDSAEHAGAVDRFLSEWAEAQRSLQEAQQREEHQEHQEATSLYLQAAAQFAQLQRDTEQQIEQEAQQRQRLQQRVLALSQQAEQSQQKAEQVAAQRYAKEDYEAGLQRVQEGQRQRASNMWEVAESHFVEAQALFVQATKRARRQKARQGAEAARNESQALYTNVQQHRAETVFPEKFAEATTSLTTAEQAWTREEFAVAEKTFNHVSHLLRQLTQDVILRNQRNQAEQAQAHARSWKQKVGPATGEQQEASQAFTAGERYFQQGKYLEAQSQYEHAASLWTILLEQRTLSDAVSPPVAADTTEATVVVPSPVQQQGQLLRGNTIYALVGTALLLLIVIYNLQWFRPSVDVPPQEPPLLPKEQKEQSPQASLPVEEAVTAFPAPVIVSMIPEPANEFVLKEGTPQTFSIHVTHPAKNALRYVWRLDGKEQSASENEWRYIPNFEEGNESVKTVEVTVSDNDNHQVSQHWRGRVQNVNRQPQITTATPRPGSINVNPEGVQRFVIEATDPDRDDRLAVTWFLDGQKVATEKRWDFRASASTSSEESHQISVEVADTEGLKTQLAWNVTIQGYSPLALTQVLPDPVQRHAVDEGKSLPFVVGVEGGAKGPRRYLWQLDGKSQRGDGNRWTYQPSYDDGGGETPKTVEVVVADSANHRVQQRWQVNVRNVNRPPQIQNVTPRTKTLEMTVQATQDFAVDASDDDRDDRLAYVWMVNGQEVTREKRWQFRAPSTPGPYTIAAEVSDGAGVTQQHVWEVLVKAVIPPAQPPVWKLSDPQEGRLSVQAGQPHDFSVTAEIAEAGKASRVELRYMWTVNGETQSVSDGRFRLVETTRPGTYEIVAVAIGPQGLKSPPKRWTVEIQPLPPPSSTALLSEAEVRMWLEMYRRAFAEKNTNTLVQLGTHTQAQADGLAQLLRSYRSYQVTVGDVSIRCEGMQATLMFKRRDTMEGETRDTDLITFALEKGTDGRITVVRR